MCIAIGVPKGTAFPSKEELQRCFNANSHGAGFCWATGDETIVHAHKGLMTFDVFYKAFTERVPEGAACLIHFRIGTAGKRAAGGGHHPECTHPFPVTNNTNSLFMLDYTFEGPCLVHNGVISSYGRGDMSDTQEFVAAYSTGLVALSAAGEYNKIAILYPDAHIEYHSKSWIPDGGRMYSNSGYKAYTAPAYNSASFYEDNEWDYQARAYVPRKTKTNNAGCGWSTSSTGRGASATIWSERTAGEIGLFFLDDDEWVMMADGTYNTTAAIVKLYDGYNGSNTSYSSVKLCADVDGCAWLLINYRWPIPCGRLTSEKDKKDRRAISKIIKDREAAMQKELEAEANESVAVGGRTPATTAPAGTTTVPATTRTPATTPVGTTVTGKIPVDYVPPGGVAAWRGFKVGDHVMVDDVQCTAKNGKTGVIEEMPDYKRVTTTYGVNAGGTNNRCVVKLDNAGGKYQTTKPWNIKLLSSELNGVRPSTALTTTTVDVPKVEAPAAPAVTPPPAGFTSESMSGLQEVAQTVLGA